MILTVFSECSPTATVFVRAIDQLSEKVEPAETTYMGEDGLLHCAVCHDRVQTVVEFLGIQKTVNCICSCIRAKMDAEEERKRQEENNRNRRRCFAETNMSDWTFDKDDQQNPKLSKAMRNYADKFPEFLKMGKGLVMYGTVGTGKTFYAACIANALLDKGYKVYMTNFAELTNRIQGMFEGRQEFIDSLNRNDLLVIDDLGAERNSASGYMQEMVFNIIDSRYRSGLPFIVTTNLTADQLKNPKDISYQRIYDRILERCHPVEVTGQSRRRKALINTHADVQAMLELD